MEGPLGAHFMYLFVWWKVSIWWDVFLNTQPNKHPWHHQKFWAEEHFLGFSPMANVKNSPVSNVKQNPSSRESCFSRGKIRGAHGPGEQLQHLRIISPQKLHPNQSCTSVWPTNLCRFGPNKKYRAGPRKMMLWNEEFLKNDLHPPPPNKTVVMSPENWWMEHDGTWYFLLGWPILRGNLFVFRGVSRAHHLDYPLPTSRRSFRYIILSNLFLRRLTLRGWTILELYYISICSKAGILKKQTKNRFLRDFHICEETLRQKYGFTFMMVYILLFLFETHLKNLHLFSFHEFDAWRLLCSSLFPKEDY